MDVYKTLAERMHESVTFYTRLSEAEGRPTPELDDVLANDSHKQTPLPPIDDPLERAGARYARMSDAYIISSGDYPFEMRRRRSGPTPFEVFAWFHMLIAVKLYRALYCSALAVRGDASKRDDALVSAKVALIGIDRSLDAVTALFVADDDERLELLGSQLRRLRREVDARFPGARAFVRKGLD